MQRERDAQTRKSLRFDSAGRPAYKFRADSISFANMQDKEAQETG